MKTTAVLLFPVPHLRISQKRNSLKIYFRTPMKERHKNTFTSYVVHALNFAYVNPLNH